MGNNSTLKFWKILAGILVALNVCLMLTIWCNPFQRCGHERGGPFNFVVKELDMSPQQVAAYKQLRDWHHDSIEVLHHEGRVLREDLFNNLKGKSADVRVVDSLTNLIGYNQKQIEAVTYIHFKQVRALCDDKQKVIFDNIIDGVLRSMSQPGPPPPGREDEPPPGK